MDIRDLVGRLRLLEQANIPVEECGMPMPPPPQQDNVDMNITIHGSGSNGIRDLLNILNDIDQAPAASNHSAPDEMDTLFGGEHDGPEIVVDDDYENSPAGASGEEVYGIDAVTNTGAPINAGDHRPRQAGLPQGAPVQEALVSRLAQMYNEIKEGDQKTMSRAAKGNEKYGKDGMQALAKAGREGKSLEPVKAKYNKYD
jgi:hypothetical protein